MNGCCADRISAARAGRFNNGCTEATCMSLPDGATCGDCKHVRHCVAMYAVTPERTTCDFFPRRFIRKAQTP
jgi:hypothetical protein